MGTFHVPCQKRGSNNNGKSYANAVLRFAGINPSALSGKACDAKQCIL
jgi:hypothetical protein